MDYFVVNRFLNILACREGAMLGKVQHHYTSLFLKVRSSFLYQLQDKPIEDHKEP